MKRWNGWGDEEIDYPLPAKAGSYLAELIGHGERRQDAALSDVISSVPESRLQDHPLITKEPLGRLRHARGQSLPDWIALRSGRIDAFPDGVTYPSSNEEVRDLLSFARKSGSHLIPYGGGTSVVGHINTSPGEAPVLIVDLSRLNRLLDLDETSHLATFEAGVNGPELEGHMRPHGYTLGHFPQSFEYSTLGGWIATRSSGQQSYHYGRIEQLFAGGHVETPVGSIDLPALPASAAGPDLRHSFLGSEGRFGLITQAIVRVSPLPEVERFQAVFFQDWFSGVAAVRAIAQAKMPVSMIRLSDSQETQTTLVLAGRERLIGWADKGLRLLRYGPQRCLLIYGLTGENSVVGRVQGDVATLTREYGGLGAGAMIGDQWRKRRFLAPYLRNTLWELGYAIDTLETAVPWSSVLDAAAAIKDAIENGLADSGERVLVFAHLSHVYPDGASIYITYLFRRAKEPEETLRRWRILKTAASRQIIAHKGTISHQHGVGVDHSPYLESEKGELGLDILRTVQQGLDPEGLLNPGKLLADADRRDEKGA